ncbi:MAG TPA: hypothetical protein DDZ51_15275 [Planctomycetaceae bacterium]|nr:hypothetical protein [Planctomycetaceae bacterium]
MEFFFLSCAANPKFHWRIFTDADCEIAAPGNVFFHAFTTSALESLASERFKSPYKFSYGYKLCDLKPTYGHLFFDYLKGYTFWGYTDLDLIYGDISSFVDDAMLSKFDIITASERILVGHFTLIRNREDLWLLYTECDGYLAKLQSFDYEVFDENDFAVLVKAKATDGKLCLFQESIQTDDCIIWWAGRSHFLILWWRGKLIDLFSLRRLSYFHFIQSKYKPFFKISRTSDLCGSFFVDIDGVHSVQGVCSLWRFVVAFARTLFYTMPWYLKNVLKIVLPKNTRLKIRTLMR